MKRISIFIGLLFLPLFLLAQQTKDVNWMNFQKLDSVIYSNHKPTVLFFYADWCTYCKKMEKVAFKKPEIVQKLNANFNVVKMNSETTDTIVFDGKTFVNAQAAVKRNSIHQLAVLFMKRRDKPFTLPVTVLLDKDFRVVDRSFQYLGPKAMLKFLDEVNH